MALPRTAATKQSAPFRHLDVTLPLAAFSLAAIGLLMVYSSTHQTLQHFGQDPGFYLKRQAIFLTVAAVAMLGGTMIDYRIVRMAAPLLYGVALLLLILVWTPIGHSALGAQRWFQIGGFQLSPSLLARVVLVLTLAAYLSGVKGDVALRHVVAATFLAALFMFWVFIQPDIGTSMILACILVALLVVSGAKVKHLAVLALLAAVTIFGAFQLGIVKEYQIQRLTSFIDPSADARRAGYNKQQAEIAIGAGGLFGRGYLRGTQTNLDFVPDQHTDFIFTAVGEELGFVGASVLLLLFGVLIWRAFRIALLARDPFGTYVAVGVAAMFSIQLFVNVGMTIGIMPITGIPLPFVSYGGSALVTDFVAVGLLNSIHMRRFL
ncbi:MAG TPA: rod shape-determining protein RodA [Actinomycetota bacterium]